MLAIEYTLVTENLHDREFLDRYCVGFDRLERYILGSDDGQPKSPEWAEPLTEISAGEIRSLARRMAGKRVFISTTWSLQRSEFGEQPPWMGVALAALLGPLPNPLAQVPVPLLALLAELLPADLAQRLSPENSEPVGHVAQPGEEQQAHQPLEEEVERVDLQPAQDDDDEKAGKEAEADMSGADFGASQSANLTEGLVDEPGREHLQAAEEQPS
jgi:hypothetical protein